MRAALFALCLAGCLMPDPKDPRDAALNECIADARADYYVGGLSLEETLDRFEDCKRRAGL